MQFYQPCKNISENEMLITLHNEILKQYDIVSVVKRPKQTTSYDLLYILTVPILCF